MRLERLFLWRVRSELDFGHRRHDLDAFLKERTCISTSSRALASAQIGLKEQMCG